MTIYTAPGGTEERIPLVATEAAWERVATRLNTRSAPNARELRQRIQDAILATTEAAVRVDATPDEARLLIALDAGT